jgi:hypothetical protein
VVGDAVIELAAPNSDGDDWLRLREAETREEEGDRRGDGGGA